MTRRHALFGFEKKRHPVLPRRQFVRRMARSLGIASGLALLSLLVGMAGYHFLENLPWIDAFVNAAMILGGMGPVDPLKTDGGKLFAGGYALYCGLVVIITAGVIFAPVMHRLLHKFHAEEDEQEPKDGRT